MQKACMEWQNLIAFVVIKEFMSIEMNTNERWNGDSVGIFMELLYHVYGLFHSFSISSWRGMQNRINVLRFF